MKQKRTTEEAIIEIEKICKENDYLFLGFDNEENEYKNNETHLVLHCNKCGETWNTASYDKFVRVGRRCPGCNKKVFKKDEIILKIKERCEELDFAFLGFVDEEPKNKNAKIKLKCNKCEVDWNTTTIGNFLRKDRKSHRCGRKNALSMPSVYNVEKEIERLNKKLEGTSLEFVDFDGPYIGFNKSYVLLKCKKCGEIDRYSLHNLIYCKNQICCRLCEFNGKRDVNDVISEIKKKCDLMNYEFLGFANEKNMYKDMNTHIVLKCNDCGYVWKTTTYCSFISHEIKCVNCKNNWHLEKQVKYFLTKNGIEYEFQKRFDWLKNKIALSLDFYLPEYNIAIECQGRQHFMPVERYGGKDAFVDTIKRDETKKKLCDDNKVKLCYFSNLKQYNTFMNEKIIKNENDLISIIYGEKN